MAVEGLGNLVQNLADHLFGQGPAVQAGTRIFEALAQKAAQQNAAAAPPASVTGSATTTAAGSNANNGSFQVQQILIQLADSQGTPNSQLGNGGQSSPVNPSPSNAAGLQVEQVQF
jgi:hypothetical protein